MKLELSHLTPYILFMFGLVMTYIGWTTKKILENIEDAIKKTSEKVDNHDHHIAEILSVIRVHDFKIDNLHTEVVQLKKRDRIEARE